MPPGRLRKSPASIASSERTPILVASAICCSVTPRLRRIVANPRTLFFSFIGPVFLSGLEIGPQTPGAEGLYEGTTITLLSPNDKLPLVNISRRQFGTCVLGAGAASAWAAPG